jgi:hypothetical protein
MYVTSIIRNALEKNYIYLNGATTCTKRCNCLEVMFLTKAVYKNKLSESPSLQLAKQHHNCNCQVLTNNRDGPAFYQLQLKL